MEGQDEDDGDWFDGDHRSKTGSRVLRPRGLGHGRQECGGSCSGRSVAVIYINRVVRLKCLQDLKDVRTTDVRMLHDGYMKLYQLENPVRRACGNTYDAILINEAQDMNPAILDVISKQTQSPRMFVGDPNQQIYSFRGTTNAFEEIKETITSTFYLTQIFRFGPDIAFIDNCWLDIVKGESRKMLIGCEKKSRIIDFCPHMALHSRFIPFGEHTRAAYLLARLPVQFFDDPDYRNAANMRNFFEHIKNVKIRYANLEGM